MPTEGHCTRAWLWPSSPVHLSVKASNSTGKDKLTNGQTSRAGLGRALWEELKDTQNSVKKGGSN